MALVKRLVQLGLEGLANAHSSAEVPEHVAGK
jgi:hypothetical protein